MVIELNKNFNENDSKKEVIKFEEPVELKELKKEVIAKRREVLDKVTKFSLNLEIKEEEEIKLKEEEILEQLQMLNEVLDVIGKFEKNKKEKPEFIEKQKLLAIKNLNEINQKEDNQRFNDLVSKITLDKLNSFKGWELEELNNILSKIKENKLLDAKERVLLKDFSEREINQEKLEEEGDKNKFFEQLDKNEEEKEDEIKKEFEEKNKNEKELENEFQEEFEEKNKKEKFEEENKEVEIENLEKKILSLKEAEEQLSNAKEEYLKKYQEYESKKLAFQKEKKEILKNKLKEELEIAKVYLANAENFYKKALEDYKVAYYFNQLNNKKSYVFSELLKNKGDILRQELKQKNPNLTEKEINDLVVKEIIKETEEIIKNEKKDLDKGIIGGLAYDVLAKQEELANKKLEILRGEKEKSLNWLSKIWDKYKNLSFSKKVLVGALISGSLAGGSAVLAGAGFAALGIGSIAALRRFVSGFVIGGSIKGISENAITKKEKEMIKNIKDKRVEEVKEEIAEALNNPEKILKQYDDFLKVMQNLDQRLDGVLKEVEAIKNKNEKLRKRWTAIAIGIGGLAANADNIYNLFKGVISPENVSQSQGGVANQVIESSNKISQSEVVSEFVSQVDKNSVPIGKGGFWEAALTLKKQLGLSAEDFEKAWSNSKVIDPVDGKEYLMPKAHFIKSLTSNQDMFLSFDAEKKIFKAVLGPKVDVGGAAELLDAYYKIGRKIPSSLIESLKKAGDLV